MSDLDDFLTEFDHATSDVRRATRTTFADGLEKWFQTIDENAQASAVSQQLESRVDFEKWYQERTARMTGMVGSGQLKWPPGKEERLAMQVALFRGMQKDAPEFVNFYMHFFGGSTRYDHMIQEIVAQLFEPMARDLRTYLLRHIKAADSDSVPVPASDRTVTLDDNKPDHAASLDALSQVQRLVTETNDYDDPNDKQQRIAELEAGRRLLQAPRVRVDALIAVLRRVLTYLAKKFMDAAIGKAAIAALALIGKMTNLW